MKKIALMLAATTFALVLAGCGTGVLEPSGSEAGTSGSAALGETSAETSPAETSPVVTVIQGEVAWSEAEDVGTAVEGAGFSSDFKVPDTPPVGDYEWTGPNFMAMDNVAEAFYDGGEVSLLIRKGEGVPIEELSADLNEYSYDWTQNVGSIEVTCHGYEENVANFLEWEYDDCSYDVWCISTTGDNVGMTSEEVAAIVAAID